MLKIYGICANCLFWRQGVPSDMRLPAEEDRASDMGACEIATPHLFDRDGELVPFQPVVHCSRSCGDFTPPEGAMPFGGDDPDDDPDGPDGEPHPVPSRVRQLFPIKPAPIAA